LVDTEADFTRVTKLLGDATGTRPAADSLLTVFTARLDSATVRNPHPPTVFILAWESPPMTLGAGSFLSQIIDRAGARNLFADLEQSSAPISVEAVAARNPDFILVVTDKEPGVTRRPEWQPVRAVRERRFLRVLGSEFSRPSPRMPDAVWALRRALAAVR
jgi:ABC-type Fe3+-hydroxamate transport system substrate-binding protein